MKWMEYNFNDIFSEEINISMFLKQKFYKRKCYKISH